MTSDAPKQDDDPVEFGTDLSLEAWLAAVLDPKRYRDRLNTYNFPTDAHREEYLRTIGSRSDAEIRLLLRSSRKALR